MADLPVIMATAKDQSGDIVEALKLGANDYVTKPLDFPVVLARVETQLSLKRAKAEIQQLAKQLAVRHQPAMRRAAALQTTRIPRVAGLTNGRTAVVTTRPFRAPHHTIADVGAIGGGQLPMPGEVSLAHRGICFWMSCRSSRAWCSRSCDSRSRRMSSADNLASIINLNTFAVFALRVMIARESGRAQ
jgi:Magnesium chelatase, subunit ChlI